jgi:rod shape-determining protein MreD
VSKYNFILENTVFLFIGVVFVIFALTPTGLTPSKQIFPDFLFCFIFIILVRKPKIISILSVIFICLLADVLWFRPVGLTTITYILAAESLRAYLQAREKIGLVEEIVVITTLYIIMTSIQEVTKFFTLIPSLALSNIISYVMATSLLYVAIVLIVRIMGSKLSL